MFNFVTLRYAAAIQHPWLQAIVLADQRAGSVRRRRSGSQGHLNAMAMRLGELQAQMMRLDGLGETARQGRRLEAAGIAVAASRRDASGAAAPSRRCRRATLTVDRVRELLAQSRPAGRRALRSARRSRKRCSSRTRPTASSCRRWHPIVDGWFSSNFGYRIDPFTGRSRLSRGRRFPGRSRHADRRCRQRQGDRRRRATASMVKSIEIDHGNGLVSRYAHASRNLRERRRSRRARPADRDGRVDRPFDRPSPALRGPAERRPAESGALPADPAG